MGVIPIVMAILMKTCIINKTATPTASMAPKPSEALPATFRHPKMTRAKAVKANAAEASEDLGVEALKRALEG